MSLCRRDVTYKALLLLPAKARSGGHKGERDGDARRRPGPLSMKALSRAEQACVRIGGHRNERVGEAAHPGPGSLRAASLTHFLLISWAALQHHGNYNDPLVLEGGMGRLPLQGKQEILVDKRLRVGAGGRQ